jgi:hypothetical protein
MVTPLILAVAMAAGLDVDLRAIAALPGEPSTVAAAGLTKTDAPILSIENASAFDPAPGQRRLVVVGGFDGDDRSAGAVVDLLRWYKTRAPAAIRRQWTMSALPSAAFDAADTLSLQRWVTFQAPDLLIVVRDTGATPELGGLEGRTISSAAAVAAARRLIEAAPATRSPVHEMLMKRVGRAPVDVATLLARRYPETPAISYIPSVSWANALRAAAVTGDQSLAARVREQTAPWVAGRPLFGSRVQLTSVAGTFIFAELGADALPLALEGAKLAAARKQDGTAEYGQGWTDDMFMASVVLSRVGRLPEHSEYLDAAARLLIDYARRLQREDGLFMHAVDGPFAWGRGNGFAAFGLMEALTALPEGHALRAELLAIFRRHMAALKRHQSPDGTWREVVDEPGAYREETVTAMVTAAIARGLRLGWLDSTYTSVVHRAWLGVAAHVAADGTIVDVCTGTGAGPTRRYYLDRAAITGADDRGGAMALYAAMEYRELVNRAR